MDPHDRREGGFHPSHLHPFAYNPEFPTEFSRLRNKGSPARLNLKLHFLRTGCPLNFLFSSVLVAKKMSQDHAQVWWQLLGPLLEHDTGSKIVRLWLSAFGAKPPSDKLKNTIK